MTDQSTYDVAIVGYGPTGAAAANLLGQMGLKVVVIDREAEVYANARAISTDEEVLRHQTKVRDLQFAIAKLENRESIFPK